jgi:soluble lytic murein transglycosylase-like protein
MVSLGVGRGGSQADAFLKGQQMADQSALTQTQMQVARAEDARRAQEFDWKGQDRALGIAGQDAFLADNFGSPRRSAGLGVDFLGGGGQAGVSAGYPTTRPPGMGGAPTQRPVIAARQPDTPLAQRLAPVWDQIEQQLGIPQGYMRRLAEIESSLNPAAKNPNSTALGLFQFLRGTAQEYGVADPSDPMQATQGTARYTANSLPMLRRALGREPTGGELYLAHQQGQQGAVNLLRDPSRRASDVVGRDAVRLNGGNPDTMTAGEFANLWIRKFEGGSSSRRAVPPRAGSSTPQAPDRMFMQPDSMQTRAGLAEPFMLGQRGRPYESPPAPTDVVSAFSPVMSEADAYNPEASPMANPLRWLGFGPALDVRAANVAAAPPPAEAPTQTTTPGVAVQTPTPETVRPEARGERTPSQLPTIEELEDQLEGGVGLQVSPTTGAGVSPSGVGLQEPGLELGAAQPERVAEPALKSFECSGSAVPRRRGAETKNR